MQYLTQTLKLDYSNLHLQAYVWAKARSLIVNTGEQALALLAESERIGTDLELHEALNPTEKLYILIREWVDIDPAFEFRTFISNNKMTGIS